MRFRAVSPVLLAVLFAVPALAQESTRADFDEYCRAAQGRWLGDITWATDWPGFGKKGEKVTAYGENKIAEDGNALVARFYGGNGSGTGIIVFDAGAKQIKGLWVSSGGGVSNDVSFKKDGKWVTKSHGSNPDGAIVEMTQTLTISENGNKHVWDGGGTVGGKKIDDFKDVWRRVSK